MNDEDSSVCEPDSTLIDVVTRHGRLTLAEEDDEMLPVRRPDELRRTDRRRKQEHRISGSDLRSRRERRGTRAPYGRLRDSMRAVSPGLIPDEILRTYEIHNWRNAVQILAGSYPGEWEDILDVLGTFVLRRSDVVAAGGRKSNISTAIDAAFEQRGWREREVTTKVSIDEDVRESRTHKIDCLKSRIGLEIEWNSKDQTFVRDLNTFRVLFDLQVLDVGVIVTRADHLQEIFDSLGIGSKYGASTTHMGKLLPRLVSGGGGGCPVLVFGITQNRYDPSS